MEYLVIRNLEVSPIDKDKEVNIEMYDSFNDRCNLIFLSIDEVKELIEFLKEQIETNDEEI